MEFTSRRLCRYCLLFCALIHISHQIINNVSIVNEIFMEKLYPVSVRDINFQEFSRRYDQIIGREEMSQHQSPISSKNLTECLDFRNKEIISYCLFTKLGNSCLRPQDLYEIYSLPVNSGLSPAELTELSPAILYSLQQPSCQPDSVHDNSPSITAVWGYGFLFVTIINLCSLVGVVVLPFMKMVIYRLLLVYMVALAVGTLAGSGLLFLIPEAFGLASSGDASYIWKATTVIGGIYLFYLTERIMKMLTHWRQGKKMERREKNIYCSIRQRTPKKSDSELKDPSTINTSGSACTQISMLNEENSEDSSAVDNVSIDKTNTEVDKKEKEANGTTTNTVETDHKPVSTVAYMIIFGDGLHNFIDGLSIGAAFTNSILSGVSVSVACICEELPHELGDFAILLNSGMSLKKALMYNFLSACMCYLGLAVGILVGESTHSHEWIFAVAGGMFLYISLVDMMPEMNSAAESGEAKRYGTIKIFILQNIGLLSGFTIMLIMALYGGEISFE